MATPPRATAQAALTFDEARGLVLLAFDQDGERSGVETEALLLLDLTAAWLEKADIGRRRREHFEATGEDSAWLIRLDRELRANTEDVLKAA